MSDACHLHMIGVNANRQAQSVQVEQQLYHKNDNNSANPPIVVVEIHPTKFSP